MDLFGRKGRDPLLFDCDDSKNDFDSLLGDRDYSKLDTSGLDLDLDAALDPNSDLGNWLHNSSLSQLTSALDTDNEASLSEGNLLPVNPESIMAPMQMPQQTPACDIDSDIDIANSAAMRLHANCRDVENLQKAVLVQQQQPQQTQHIQLVAVPVATAAVSNGSASSTPVHSPLKANTIILDPSNMNTFSVAGTTYIASPQKLQGVSSSLKTRCVLTPSQCSPVLVGHLQSGINLVQNRPIAVTVSSPLKNTNYTVTHQQHTNDSRTVRSIVSHEEKVYPKPVFSYSCLIALALKNSKTGNLPVSEIYNFMCENFPYFKTAPDGWKNSVRHNLSLNKCFAKVDNPKLSSGAKKGCLWALNPAKKKKMEEEISKWGKKDPVTLLNSMAYPENLEAIEKGQAGLPLRTRKEDDDDENCPSPSLTVPIKKEIAVTSKHIDSLVASELKEESFDILEEEYASHAHHWAQEPDEDLHIDVFTHSPLASSPLLTRSSPLPHTPSRSGSLTSV